MYTVYTVHTWKSRFEQSARIVCVCVLCVEVLKDLKMRIAFPSNVPAMYDTLSAAPAPCTTEYVQEVCVE